MATIQAELQTALAYSVPQAAQRINIPETKVWRAIRDGQLRSFKIGRSRRVTEAALVEFITTLEGMDT